ncbi:MULTISPECIES: type 1 glutamine amidotransferase [unclassified Kitasatospora]|uniref:type 1 glutamine amidotransferase n=1 Tax=unclassified Kitasatospora TaxID=2633591 RepID=UPI002476B460|nr:type 1 glutamine amidotransferase [Kitasatospora sp. MAP12-44]
MGILIVQNSPTAPEGEIGTVLEESGVRYEVVRAWRRPLPDAADWDAVIVLGGGQHAADESAHPYLAPQKALLREAVAAGRPCLGICLGGQLLAHALGAELTRGTSTEFGFQALTLTEDGRSDPLFAGLAPEQRMFQWHADSFTLPPGARPLVHAEPGAGEQAFRVGRRGYGVQFHPELSEHLLHQWLAAAATPEERIPPEALARAIADTDRHYPEYRRQIRRLIANFLTLSEL